MSADVKWYAIVIILLVAVWELEQIRKKLSGLHHMIFEEWKARGHLEPKYDSD
jgi:hypothetical protein